MTNNSHFDVLIIGGSYSGLSAAMALGRALRKVLVVDSGLPCNRQTPHSHNFLTQDGKTPNEIAALARQQVERYDSVHFIQAVATSAVKKEKEFELECSTGQRFYGKKLIFATGIRDLIPEIAGFKSCWGISLLHCPYCHGYEVKNEPTGLLANGSFGFEFSALLSNWTKDLSLFTNGPSTLSPEQTERLKKNGIKINETEIEKLEETNGYVSKVVFKDGSWENKNVLYTRFPFEQHCLIPRQIGCKFTEDGYLETDVFQKTSVHGVFAAGDATGPLRSVSNAVALGTKAAMMANKEIVMEEITNG